MTSTLGKAAPLSIYTVLTGEHREVSAIIATLEATPSGMEAGKSGLYTKLKNELLSHAEAEEETVYARLKARQAERGIAEHAKREHQDIQKHLDELDAMNLSDDSWNTKLDELKQSIEHHVTEEEEVMFRDMRTLFSDEEATEMGKIFVERKNTILTDLKARSQSGEQRGALSY